MDWKTDLFKDIFTKDYYHFSEIRDILGINNDAMMRLRRSNALKHEKGMVKKEELINYLYNCSNYSIYLE